MSKLAISYRMKKRAHGGCMAKGGPVMAKDEYEEDEGSDNDMSQGYQTGDRELDMIGRIMKHRETMSKGGEVANTDLPEADFMPNEFDDLHLRDDLESEYTGANSGDEIGDEQEDEDRKNMVSRIMRSRKKSAGHNPRPA